jgi:hypothetical protein
MPVAVSTVPSSVPASIATRGDPLDSSGASGFAPTVLVHAAAAIITSGNVRQENEPFTRDRLR